MEAVHDENRFIACSDIISLVLLGFALRVAEIDPRRRVWGRSKLRRFLITFAVAINVIFSLFRLVFECVRVDTGPREFLLLSVIYCSRWMWLCYNINRSRPGKAFEVAMHLKNLKMIRKRKSSRGPNSEAGTQSTGLSQGLRALALRMMNWRRASEPTAEAPAEQGLETDNDGTTPTEQGSDTGDGRKGEWELVIRRGERNLPRHGAHYWRGVEESVETYVSYEDEHKLHLVRLVERELHSDNLNEIGTYAYKRRLEVEGIDGLYKKIYDLVMTCDVQEPNLTVDYEHFLKEYRAIAVTNLAERIGAKSETPLGDVARRIAADACYYVTNDTAQLRTKRHVERINECIEEAAKASLSNYTICNPVSESGGENIVPNNRDANV